MKVTFNQSYTVAIDGINIVTFAENTTHDLPDDKAMMYIERGVCAASGTETIENKMAEPVVQQAVQKREYRKKGK